MSSAAFSALLELLGDDAARWVAAFFRVLPSALIVPAFGAAFLPWPLRAAIGLALVIGVAPAMEIQNGGSLAFLALLQALGGVPVALSAAAALWAASMAGGLFDELRTARAWPQHSPTTTLLALFAAAAFLQMGGPARIVAALAGTGPAPLLTRAATDVAAGIGIAVALAGPLLVVTIVADVGRALMTRSLPDLEPLSASVRSLFVLAAGALVFERIAELVVLLSAG